MKNIEKAALLEYSDLALTNEEKEEIIYNCYDGKCTYNGKVLNVKGNMPDRGKIIVNDTGVIFENIIIKGYNCIKENNKFTCNNTGLITVNGTNILIDNNSTTEIEDYRIYGNSLNNIPTEYQQVEYIESTGTQYIDTLYKANPKTKIELDIQFFINDNQFNEDADSIILGSSIDEDNRFQANFGETAEQSKMIFYWTNLRYNSKDVWARTYSNVTDRSTMIITNNSATFQNKTISTDTKTTINEGNLIVFGGYNRNKKSLTIFNRYNLRVYSIKIYDDDTIVRNLIPCYRKIDNSIGMYDSINKKFYQNIGEGEFIKGEQINTDTGNLITLDNCLNYGMDACNNVGKYIIPIKVTKSEPYKEKVYNIYLSLPLRSIGEYTDYIDFKNKKVVYYSKGVKTEEDIDLPSISINKDTSIISVNTTVQPSNIEVEYYK